MKISMILDQIDLGAMALPEFQRGYVWNGDQVRSLMQSLYRRHPIGSLLVWVTESRNAKHRGDGGLAPGIVKLLLDGQQRMTSLYGIVRGRPPRFFDDQHGAKRKAFEGLHFHLEEETFEFWQPVKMRDDPLWIDVSTLMRENLESVIPQLTSDPARAAQFPRYVQRLNRVLGIQDVDLHVEEVTGEDKTIEVVVDIFNRVNSGGTKLSKGDLALAKICAEAPDAREGMKHALTEWKRHGYRFNLDWLLRCVNTISTGEAKFHVLHEVDATTFEDGLTRATRAVDEILNLIAGRLGLDHDRVLFGRYAIPVMAHYLDRRGMQFANATEQDRLLFWYLHSAMWGRYSSSTETVMDRDLKHLEAIEGGLDRLLEEARVWRGSFEVLPENFAGWSRGARFYPMLYMLTRVRGARDFGSGIELKRALLGAQCRLEIHHIFPKALLYKHGYSRPEVNAIANFCFLTRLTNEQIGARPPREYFREMEEAQPGALASQWIPSDPALWEVENYPAFLEARRGLLAEATNRFLEDLLHGNLAEERVQTAALFEAEGAVPGGIDTPDEERALLDVNAWLAQRGLPEGELLFDLTDAEGRSLAILDLAWPEGLQHGLSEPVCLLLEEGDEIQDIVNRFGYRYFTDVSEFREYVRAEGLDQREEAA